MSAATISVVVTTFQRDDLLAECLASLAAQDLPLTDVLVVDDGGPGSAKTLVESCGAPFRYVWQANAGQQAARNEGVRQTSSDWICFLDDDDLWLPHRHQQIRRAADALAVDLIVTDFIKFRDKVDDAKTVFEQIEAMEPGFFDGIRPTDGSLFSTVPRFPVERLIPHYPFWPSSMAITRKAFDALRGWDVALRGVKAEDIDFAYRALSQFSLGISWAPSLRYRCHPSNDARDTLENLKGRIHIWQRLLDQQPMSEAVRQVVESRLEIMRHDLLWEGFERRDYAAVLEAYRALPGGHRSLQELFKALLARLGLLFAPSRPPKA